MCLGVETTLTTAYQRWMHSMHVDAFFEYLLENPHPYWTDIPSNPNPVSEGGRDGVAAEDDMALRSLLPQIRPRRGRKRPDDESLSRSPSQKTRMEQGNDLPNTGGPGVEQLDMWAGQPEARSGGYLFAQDHFARMNVGMGSSGSWAGDAFPQTPMSAHPYSEVTPATANAFWSDQPGDSQSVLTTPKPKANRRHGAKVVSSAWRSGGPGGSGKTRGRPPLNRQNTSTSQTQSEAPPAASPFSAFPVGQSVSPPTPFRQTPQQLHNSPHMMNTSLAHPMMALGSAMPGTTMGTAVQQGLGMQQQEGYDLSGQQHDAAQTRDLRMTRSRLSLQVPERIGADIRLATPQGQQATPVVMVNGTMTNAGDQASIMAQHHQGIGAGLAGTGMHMMDSFETVAAQSMYNLQFQQQGQHQQTHHPHQQVVDTLSHASRDTASIYSPSTTTTTTTHQTHHPPHQHSPPQALFQQHHPTPSSISAAGSTLSTGAVSFTTDPTTAHHPAVGGGAHRDDAADRTNADALESLLAYELLGADWRDARGRPAGAGAGVDEATALARAVIEGARREARSAQAFLMNLAALAGTTWLRQEGERTRVYRMGDSGGEEGEREGEPVGAAAARGSGSGSGRGVYEIHFSLQLGDVRSSFSLREEVVGGGERWTGSGRRGDMGRGVRTGSRRGDGEREEGEEDAEGEYDDDDDDAGEGEGEDEDEGGEGWRQRYLGLLDVMQQQRAEMSHLRRGVLDLCRPRSRTGHDDAQDDAMG